MTKVLLLGLALSAGAAALAAVRAKFEEDVIPTSKGDLAITFLGHGSLMMRYADKIIHVDPVGQEADYGRLPKADLVLITHDHYDHLDPKALGEIVRPGTEVIVSRSCSGKVEGAVVMSNGETHTALGLSIAAVPAYNVLHKRPDGAPFHPRGDGNGYIVTFGDKRVYIAGDTENTPEMKTLKDIDVAFLPMNLPYTMTPEMVADAARAIRPKILYPYHYGETRVSELVDLLKKERGIEVRIRDLK